MKKIERTTAGLVNAMFDEFDAIIAGKSTPQQARAKATLCGVIIATKRLEMDMTRFVSEERLAGIDDKPKLKAIALGA